MIVREIADAHGWSVSVADSVEGARFEVHTEQSEERRTPMTTRR